MHATHFTSYLEQIGLLSTTYGAENFTNYYFGRHTRTGLVFDTLIQSYSNFSYILNEMLTHIGLNSCDYSTHTFRKRVVRRRYLFAQIKWPMDYILAWANWSYSEDKKVLFAYLIDEEEYIQTEKIQLAMLHPPAENTNQQDSSSLFVSSMPK